MKRVAFVFSHVPHGCSAGREGLDALLAVSAYSTPAAFFIGDGVLQLLNGQQPARILGRDYIATFKLFALYDIHECWLCAHSLRQRGLTYPPHIDNDFVITVNMLEPDALRQQLDCYDVLLTF